MEPPTGARPLTGRMAELDSDDLDHYAQHVVEHMAESGREGSPHFAVSRICYRDIVWATSVERLYRGLDVPMWSRFWLLFDERRVVGHLELRGGRVSGEMHRATLEMGILRAFTGQGYGRRLVDASVRWARDAAGLRWIDLGVFSDNAPARKLYTRTGFVEVALREDAFHLDAGPEVDEVQMTLRLR
jgi:RimJ/RimL family protein N-acetyltransferase